MEDSTLNYRLDQIALKLDRVDARIDKLEGRLLTVEEVNIKLNTGFKIMLWIAAGAAALLTGWDKVIQWLR